jgi:DNA polymerase-3 subunit alpha
MLQLLERVERQLVKFNCGCSFDKFDWDKVNLDCPATYDMIGEGLTKGVFQLEASLGKKWSKLIKPRSIRELSDVISLIRPGCLNAEYRELENGKKLSIIDTYLAIREGRLAPEYPHPSLEPIFKDSYGVPIYQEQMMRICSDYAGFSLREADDARKAVGKKLPEVMAKVKLKFISSAAAIGRDVAVTEEIFSWIDKFSEYLFNLSHGIEYAILSYRTAYAKLHFPTSFFKAALEHSDAKIDQMDEIKQLVNEAKLFNIKVVPPDIKRQNTSFAVLPGKTLAFGLATIKGIGDSAMGSLKSLADANTQEDFIKIVMDKSNGIKANVAESLIKSGATDCLGGSRIELLRKFKFLRELTKREQDHVLKTPADNVHVMYASIMESKVPSKARRPKIEEAFAEVIKELDGNDKKMKLGYEKFYLGMALSGSETDMYRNPKVDTTCRDFLRVKSGDRVSMGVLIDKVREIKDKNGNYMCFLNVSDSSYGFEGAVVFASAYIKFAWIIEEGRVVLLSGKKKDSSLLVDFIEHL